MKRPLFTLFATAVLIGTATAQPWLTNGLTAHYPMDDNADDVTGNANGTPSNVTFGLDRFAASHRAAVFDGTAGSYVTINSTNWNLAPEFTASVWFKLGNGGTENPRIISAAGFELGTQTTANSRKIAFNDTMASRTSYAVESSNSVPSGVWTHAVGVRTSIELVLYLNGAVAGRLAVPEPPDYSRGVPEIGGNFGNGSDAFAGSIDDVRIYRRALSPSEVRQLFQKESQPPGGLNYELVAFYPFIGNADDRSGNDHHGTVHDANLSTDQFGKPNRAYSFDGTNGWIELPAGVFGPYQAFTLSLWFNAVRLPDMTDHEHEAEMLLSRGRNSFELALGTPPFNDSGIRFLPRQANGVGYVFDAQAASVQVSVWNHLVTVYDDTAGTARIHLNGHELTLTAFSGHDSPNETLPPRLGMRYDGTVPFQGRLDNVRVYARALSPTEVARLYAVESGQLLAIRKAVYADTTDLVVGQSFQPQFSTDLLTWTNFGAPFTATNSTWRSDYRDVDSWDQLFCGFNLNDLRLV